MSEDKTAVPQAENVDEKDTQKTDPNQVDEGTDGGDVNKEEGEDYYKQEAARLKAENEKKDEIISHKNRAIQSMKRQKREVVDDIDEDEHDDAPDNSGDLSEMEKRLLARQDEKLAQIRLEERQQVVEDEIAKVATSADHAEVIRHHLKNSIKPTGNIREDIENAQWIADKNRFKTQDAEKTAAILSRRTAGAGNFSGHKQASSSKAKPTEEDVRIANKFFNGDIDRYMKAKKKT